MQEDSQAIIAVLRTTSTINQASRNQASTMDNKAQALIRNKRRHRIKIQLRRTRVRAKVCLESC